MIIDLSSNNIHPVTWPQVKAAGVQGVILKATQGTTYVNPDYAGDVAGASAAGLPVIAYHFADFTTPVAEARYFLSVAGRRGRVLDSETNSTAAWQNAFLAALGLPGTEELDYGSASTLPSGAVRSLIWAAAYGPKPNKGEVLWQFTSGAPVPGITGTVDASEWLGTQAQFDAVFAIATPGGTDVPAPTDVVDSWSVPGTDGAQYCNLLASGAFDSYGVTVGAIEYVAVSNLPQGRYHFGPKQTPGVFTYLQLPASVQTPEFPTRYFVRMEVLSYRTEPVGVGPRGPQGLPGKEGPQGPPGPPANVGSIIARLNAAAKALAGG